MIHKIRCFFGKHKWHRFYASDDFWGANPTNYLGKYCMHCWKCKEPNEEYFIRQREQQKTQEILIEKLKAWSEECGKVKK